MTAIPKKHKSMSGPLRSRQAVTTQPNIFASFELEQEIGTLKDITGVRVLTSRNGIDEVHVLARSGRSPKKIVRDIESLLFVRYGLRIDHRCISVVQIPEKEAVISTPLRPRIQAVSRDGNAVSVKLQVGENVIVGASPATHEAMALPGAGKALLDAVEQMLGMPGLMELGGIQILEMLGQKVMVVMVRWLFLDADEVLVGACLVGENPLEAAAKATIDAINRRLVQLQRTELKQAKPVSILVSE